MLYKNTELASVKYYQKFCSVMNDWFMNQVDQIK